LEKRIRELCQILLTTEDEAVFHAAADELRQTLHQHIEELRDQTRQFGVADRILTPDLDALSPQPRSTSKDSPPPETTGQPATIVLQIPSTKPKRKPRRTPPAA
jgi:hypothetical protein